MAQPISTPPVVFLLARRTEAWRAPERPRPPVPSPPLLWLPLSSTKRSPVATDAVRRGHNHRLASPTPPKALPRPTRPPHRSSHPLSLSHAHGRRHRCRPPRPQPLPRLPDASQSSAGPPSSSSPRRKALEALDGASFAVPLLGHRGSPPSNPSPSGLPQARRPPLQGLRELSVRFPLSVSSFARRS